MKCLNTYGCYNKEAKYIEELKCSNFCSYDCFLIYKGKKDPPIPDRKIFKDPSRQIIHDLYLLARTGRDSRLLAIEPLKRGVKKGSRRGKYKNKMIKEKTFICKGCGNQYILKSSRVKKFHNDSCRRRYWRKKKAEKELSEHLNTKY